jgi:polyribonucleotide nucleotidyltransferase
MDIKIDGLKYEIMEAALAQARDSFAYPWKLIETWHLKEDVKAYAQKLLQEEF